MTQTSMPVKPHPASGRQREAEAARVAVAPGDGIGPEIMHAALRVLEAARARLEVVPVEIGARVAERGYAAGIRPREWEALRETGVLLKGPLTTLQGGGRTDLDLMLRRSLGLFATVRSCTSYHPFVEARHTAMDVVLVRENEEDVYSGIEHRQTSQVVQCLKLITVPGTERVVRYAFEYARAHGRARVSCFTKDGVMRLTDGLFRRIFDQVGTEYPEIERQHLAVDTGAARLADRPEDFDVVLLPNLYGDILSGVAAQASGSVGMAPSTSVGEHFALFEPVHGPAPELAGRGAANPSGLLLASAAMLAHLGQGEVAERVHNAWLRAIEDGIHTADMRAPFPRARSVGTDAFAGAVIERLGEAPSLLRPAAYPRVRVPTPPPTPRRRPGKKTIGADVFLDWTGSDPDELARRLVTATGPDLALVSISNRGVPVWPDGLPGTLVTDHWRCRFTSREPGRAVSHEELHALLARVHRAGLDWVKTESLCTFDDVPGYSLGPGL